MKAGYKIFIVIMFLLSVGCNKPHKEQVHEEEESEEHIESVHISKEMADQSGIVVSEAGSHQINTYIKIRGNVVPTEDGMSQVIPRFSGIIKKTLKKIGDKVEKGEVLAIVENNENLQSFEVRSQISGIITEKSLVAGEFVPENQWIYIISDLTEVGVDFYVSHSQIPSIKIGQKIEIVSLDGEKINNGTISYIAPIVDPQSQTQLVRLTVQNQNMQLLLGMFVAGDLIVASKQVPVAVEKEAVQTFEDMNVVFVNVDDEYTVREVELGDRNGKYIEILKGLSAGEKYVSKNSFLIKADILKSGATHSH